MYWAFTGVSKAVIYIYSAIWKWGQNLYVGKRLYLMQFLFGFCYSAERIGSLHLQELFLSCGLSLDLKIYSWTLLLLHRLPKIFDTYIAVQNFINPLVSGKFKDETCMQYFWFEPMSGSMCCKRSNFLRAEFTGFSSYSVSVLSVNWVSLEESYLL